MPNRSMCTPRASLYIREGETIPAVCTPNTGCVAAGAVPALEQLLSRGEMDMTQTAAMALRSLATTSPEARLALERAGMMPDAAANRNSSPTVPLRCAM